MKVDFQVIHSFTNDESLKENLLLLLKDTFDGSTTISPGIEEQPESIEEWSIFNRIETKYNHLSDSDKYIAGFILDLEEDSNEILQDFGEKLQANENIDLVLKYSDEGMQAEHQKYAKEIFDLEMRLREVISFIFINIYEGDYYNFLEFQKVKGKMPKKEEKRNVFEENFENEFFFLTFGQYRELHLPDVISAPILNRLIGEHKFDTYLKERILNMGIFRNGEKYNRFLKSIQQDLQSIEKLRNCIAHNRALADIIIENHQTAENDTNTILDNYQTAKKNLEEKIDEFGEGVQDEDQFSR
jgi:hypothetical protein